MTTRTRADWRDEYHAARERVTPHMRPTKDGAMRIPFHPALAAPTARYDALELEGLEHGWLTLDNRNNIPKETEA